MIPDKCPTKEDCGINSLVTNNRMNGPILKGMPTEKELCNPKASIQLRGRAMKWVEKQSEGRRKIGQNVFIRTLIATIHANRTLKYNFNK